MANLVAKATSEQLLVVAEKRRVDRAIHCLLYLGLNDARPIKQVVKFAGSIHEFLIDLHANFLFLGLLQLILKVKVCHRNFSLDLLCN